MWGSQCGGGGFQEIVLLQFRKLDTRWRQALLGGGLDLGQGEIWGQSLVLENVIENMSLEGHSEQTNE